MSTEAKTLTLTIGERLAAIRIFDAFKGSMATMKALLDDVKQLPISDDEWKTANLVKTPIKGAEGQPDSEQWKWDETVTKDVTFQPDVVDYLKEQIKQKSDAKEITIADAALVSLDGKLA